MVGKAAESVGKPLTNQNTRSTCVTLLLPWRRYVIVDDRHLSVIRNNFGLSMMGVPIKRDLRVNLGSSNFSSCYIVRFAYNLYQKVA